MILADVLRRAFSLVTVLLIARSLGVEGFGHYSFVLSFVMLFSGFTNFGLDTVLVKDVARDPQRLAASFSATFFLKLLTSSVTALIIIGAASWLDYPAGTTRAIHIMAVASIFFSLTETAASLCKGTQQMEYWSLLTIARGALLLAFVPVFLGLGGDLAHVFMAHLASAILLLVFGIIVVGLRVSRLSLKVDRTLLRQIGLSTLPFVVIGGIYMIGYRVDVLMLEHLAGNVAVGIYGSAYTPIEIVLSIAHLLTQALFPALNRAHASSMSELRALAGRSVKIFLLLSLPMTAGIILLAPQILQVMFSEEFGIAANTLRIVGGAVWISFLQILLGWLVTATDRLRVLIVINVVTLALNLGLNFLLIPTYGASGAAISQVASAVVALAILFIASLRAGILSLRGLKLPRILVATVAMGCFTYFNRDFDFFMIVGASALLYFVLLGVLHVVDRREIRELKMLVQWAVGRK